jgi:hypothetical protein
MALRTFIAAVFLSLFTKADAQTFERSFVRHEGSTDEAYYFYKDGAFAWVRKANGQRSTGTGKYSIHNDSILLTFGPAPRQLEINVESAEPTNAFISTVAVNGIYSTGNPLSGLRFSTVQSGVAGVTDGAGTGTIVIADPPSKDKVRFEFDGYSTTDIAVRLKGTNFFYAIVIDNTIFYREHETAKYKVEYSRRKLILDRTLYKRASKKDLLP